MNVLVSALGHDGFDAVISKSSTASEIVNWTLNILLPSYIADLKMKSTCTETSIITINRY